MLAQKAVTRGLQASLDRMPRRVLSPLPQVVCRTFGTREPSLLDLARDLDGHRRSEDPLPARMRKKLGEGIDASKKKSRGGRERSALLDGILSSEAEDICELFNAALETPRFADLIPWMRNRGTPADFVLISDVRLNMDSSHVTALWSSDALLDLVSAMGTDVERHDPRAAAARRTLSTKVVPFITRRLQQREPQFRAVLARANMFKRVPRVYFRAQDESLGHAGRVQAAYQKEMQDMYASYAEEEEEAEEGHDWDSEVAALADDGGNGDAEMDALERGLDEVLPRYMRDPNQHHRRG